METYEMQNFEPMEGLKLYLEIERYAIKFDSSNPKKVIIACIVLVLQLPGIKSIKSSKWLGIKGWVNYTAIDPIILTWGAMY